MQNKTFSTYKERCELSLKQYLSKQEIVSERLNSAMEYSLFNGGKRVRAILVYTVGEIFNTPILAQDHAAMALELVHAFSLVHDDLPAMDDDQLRRGKPTCHIQYDEATAILAGDALQTLAFEVLVGISQHEVNPKQLVEAIKILATTTGHRGMTAGQMLDLEAESKQLTIQSLETIHANKTGALIKAAILIPYILSPSFNSKTLQALTSFAENIGLAFQIQDDNLDVTASTQTLGKEAKRDLVLEKSTYPSLLGLEGAKVYLIKTYENALKTLVNIPENTDTLKEISHYIVHRKK